jgi:peptide methionine sulfoxide reductase MsrB
MDVVTLKERRERSGENEQDHLGHVLSDGGERF